jgi:hypothetical protein
MDIRNRPATLFTPARAVEIAAMLNRDDDDGDVEYQADHDPAGTGHSRIKVLDLEDGEIIGYI